jgi:MFS transporter, FSR family, fosmidomycin resistance protein
MSGVATPSSIDIEKAKQSGFQLSRVFTIISAHFIHDTYSAFLAPLLPNLIDKLSLTYTQAGFLSTIMQLPSLLNPIIGYLDDKVNLRILVVLAPAISATMMSLLGIAPSYLSLLALLFITGLSIAAFHAISPAMIARSSGQQVGKGMSLFMSAGELGRTVGPLFAAWALLSFTLGRMLPVAIPGWIASILIYFRFRGIPVHVEKQTDFFEILPRASRLFVPLIGLVFFRSFLITGMGFFLPTLLQSQGASVWKADTTLALYQFAGVIGAFLGGTISDRLGRKPVLFAVSLLAPIMVLIFLNYAGLFTIAALVFAGLFALSSQPITLAIIQDHFPHHRSVGNGFFTAFTFICLAISAPAIGILADRLGLLQAFQLTAFFGLLAVPMVFFLPLPPPHSPITNHTGVEQALIHE